MTSQSTNPLVGTRLGCDSALWTLELPPSGAPRAVGFEPLQIVHSEVLRCPVAANLTKMASDQKKYKKS